MDRKRLNTLAAGAAVILAAAVPASAMQNAGTKPGYQAGAELGAQFNNGTSFAGAADFNYGFKTNFLGVPYTAGTIDFLSTARRVAGSDLRANLLTLGIRQPLPTGGATPISLEAGLSYLGLSGNGSGSSTGGFVGGRATFGQDGAIGITGMARYHFVNGGFYQLGAGLTGPLGKGSGLFYQVDYYHTGGNGSINTDTVMVGARWAGGGL